METLDLVSAFFVIAIDNEARSQPERPRDDQRDSEIPGEIKRELINEPKQANKTPAKHSKTKHVSKQSKQSN